MIIFTVSLIFIILLMIIFLSFFINFGVLILRVKIFNNGFFGDLELMFNIWSLLFLFIVLIIRIRVIVFSFSYISSLRVLNFVFLYLSFVIRILWLILNNNFYWIIFGWDGLGVVSFLLIVYYINHESVNNGLFTIFQNRVGDLFFVLFIVGVISINLNTSTVVIWGLIFLIIGSSVKSAQFPFNAWLLSAIRAPTPISSLVHSSTLVVAGVYILLEFRYCLYDVLEILKLIALLRLLISFYGLINEVDIKKLIAYSTISHVSLMIYLLRYKLFKITYFHLNIHAIFKSLIFICFGFVILSSYHAQDKRLVTLVMLNPIIKIVYYFSCLCLAGLPFLSGFFSKDLIIEKIISNIIEFIFVLTLLLFLGVRMYYRLKLISLFKTVYSYSMLEINLVRIIRVLIIIFVRILVINVYLSLVFSVSLERLSSKIRVYFFILGFFSLSFFTNLSNKFNVYEKTKNFKEILILDVYLLDKVIYWNMFVCLKLVGQLSSIKLFLLVNWWLIFIFIVLY